MEISYQRTKTGSRFVTFADLLERKLLEAKVPPLDADQVVGLLKKNLDSWLRKTGVSAKAELERKKANIQVDFKVDSDDPRNLDGAISLVTNRIAKYGWFRSRMDQVYNSPYASVTYAPNYNTEIVVSGNVYHLGPRSMEERILRKGLIPRSDGAKRFGRIYPPRVFVFLSLQAAENQFFISGDLTLFEIDTSKLRRGTKFFEDTWVTEAAYTYTHIPATALNVVGHR